MGDTNPAKVFRWLVKNHHNPVRRKPGAGRPFVLTEEVYAEIKKRLDGGVGVTKISRQLLVPYHHVDNLKSRLKAGKGMPKIRPKKEKGKTMSVDLTNIQEHKPTGSGMCDADYAKMPANPEPAIYSGTTGQIYSSREYGIPTGLNIQQLAWLQVFSSIVAQENVSYALAARVADESLEYVIPALNRLA